MLRWCSYCQIFLGETAPRSDYSLTHGVCLDCKAKSKGKKLPSSKSIEPLKNFFEQLWQGLFQDGKLERKQLLEQANKLKIKKSDLLIGVMQPLLFELGTRYASGEITVLQEHRFTNLVRDLVLDFKNEDKEFELIQNPEVILACADGNYHEFGVVFLELYLKQAGIKVMSITPSVPAHELLNIGAKLGAKVLGISAVDEDHLKSVKELSKLLKANPKYRPQVIVGGLAVTKQIPKIDGIEYFNGSILDFLSWIKTALKSKKT